MPKPKKPANEPAPSAPLFKTEEAERAFWQETNTADIVDWSNAERVRFSKLKPSTSSDGADEPTP